MAFIFIYIYFKLESLELLLRRVVVPYTQLRLAEAEYLLHATLDNLHNVADQLVQQPLLYFQGFSE